MADITMCQDENCIFKKFCYRYTANPNGQYQSYFVGSPFDNDKKMCVEFIDNSFKMKRTRKIPNPFKQEKVEEKKKVNMEEVWKSRASNTADKLKVLKEKIFKVSKLLERIAHIGCRGDIGVDLAMDALGMLEMSKIEIGKLSTEQRKIEKKLYGV